MLACLSWLLCSQFFTIRLSCLQGHYPQLMSDVRIRVFELMAQYRVTLLLLLVLLLLLLLCLQYHPHVMLAGPLPSADA
jgi:hypothetical protein